MTRPPRRHGLSIALVVTMLAVVGAGLMAAAVFRQSVTRNLAGLVRGARAVAVAEAAIEELADSARLTAVFRDPGARGQLAAAFAGGAREGGVLTPPAAVIEVPAQLIAAAYQDDATIELDPVRIMPLYYRPDRRVQKGVLRFSAAARAVTAGRTVEKLVVHDYEFTVYAVAGELRFVLAPAPTRRAQG